MFRDRRRLTRLALLAILTFPALLAPAVTRAQDNAGFLYGRVVSSSGTEYRGFLRWGKQEAFWDDLFHSSKVELPYAEYAEEREDEKGGDERWWDVFGRRMNVVFGTDGSSRIFITRFGDISSIEVVSKKGAAVTMRAAAAP